MTTQTLKAIPEETVTLTVAPATPERVTSNVPKTKPATAKHPVKSGKRLVERNRLAREAKKQAEAQKPPTNTTTETNASATNNITEQSSNNSTNTVYLILTVGGFDCLCFWCILPT